MEALREKKTKNKKKMHFLGRIWLSLLCNGRDSRMDECLAILRAFQQYSVISRQGADDNERLCAMKLCLQLRIFCLGGGSNLGLLHQ